MEDGGSGLKDMGHRFIVFIFSYYSSVKSTINAVFPPDQVAMCGGGVRTWSPNGEQNDIYYYFIIEKSLKRKKNRINLWRPVLILWHCATHWSMYGKH